MTEIGIKQHYQTEPAAINIMRHRRNLRRVGLRQYDRTTGSHARIDSADTSIDGHER
ncbi:hypothetical protein KA005_22000 [bacterium]|nr:hypothetical protein [bacterium]